MASRKFYQYAHVCVEIEQMAQLILIIWKFLRNHTYKKLQQTRTVSQREETAQEDQRSCLPRKTRRGEADVSANSSSGDEDKENHGLFFLIPTSYILF